MSVVFKNRKKESEDVEVQKEPEKPDYQFFLIGDRYLNFNNIVSIKTHKEYENVMEITYAYPQLDYDYYGGNDRIYKTKYETITIGKWRFDKYLKPYIDSKTLKIL